MNRTDRDGSSEGYTIRLDIDEDVDVGALLSVIADVNTDGIRIHDVRDDDRSTVSVPVDELTEIQRETLVRAVEAGYYARPREVSLTEFVEEFDVSKSAISQRLQHAEMALVREFAEGLIRDRRGESQRDEHGQSQRDGHGQSQRDGHGQSQRIAGDDD